MTFDPMQPYGEVLETTVRVASWNVWSRFGPWEEREPVLVAALSDLDADIVCFQEAWSVDDDTQTDRFMTKLNLEHGVQFGEHEYLGIASGQAVLSRWPISESTSLKIDAVDKDGSGGGATFARIAGPRGPIDVVSLILEWRPDLSHVRSDQLTEILQWAKELSDPWHPLFICGDFNATPDSDELRALVGLGPVHVPEMVFYDAMTMRASGDTTTWSERNPFAKIGLYPEKQLDHIFSHWPKAHGAGHPVAASIIGSDPVDGIFASDHFGVTAELRY